MAIKNAYPEKPEVPYKKTSIDMASVIGYIQSVTAPIEVKRAAYVFFRIESNNGKSGVNNNYAGIQADGNRWPSIFDDLIVATSVKLENGNTGKVRRFVAFNSWKDSVNFTIRNVERRGMYIGGQTSFLTKIKVNTVDDLTAAYKKEWVKGDPDYVPTTADKSTISSIYKQAQTLFK